MWPLWLALGHVHTAYECMRAERVCVCVSYLPWTHSDLLS